MTQPFDPFEVLADLDPIDESNVRGAAASPPARAALEAILADPRTETVRSPGRRRAWPRRRLVYAIAVIALTIAVAGTAWALTRGPARQLTIGCYSAESLNADTVVVPAGTSSAVATCLAVWQRGELGARVPSRLEACVLPTGAVGVFPSQDGGACRRLQLPPGGASPTPAEPPATDGSVTALKDALVRLFLSERCLSRDAAVDAVQAEVRTLGLASWDARVTTPFTQERSCASFSFDEGRRLVLIVPVPPRP